VTTLREIAWEEFKRRLWERDQGTLQIAYLRLTDSADAEMMEGIPE
jgi:hypothetical protein